MDAIAPSFMAVGEEGFDQALPTAPVQDWMPSKDRAVEYPASTLKEPLVQPRRSFSS
jgi:hypothetical protein